MYGGEKLTKWVKGTYHDKVPEGIEAGTKALLKMMPPDSDYLPFFGFADDLIPTMNKPLIIHVAMTGFFIRKRDNPNQPITNEEVANDAIKAIRAGASMAHIHLKHPKDGSPCRDPRGIKEVMDMIWDKYPEVPLSLCPLGNPGAPTLKKVMEPLMEELWKYEKGSDRKYGAHTTMTHVDTMVFPNGQAITVTPESLKEAVKWQEAHGTKAQMQCWSAYGSQMAKSAVIDTGIATPPYLIDLDFGKEGTAFDKTPTADLWMYRELLNWIEIAPKKNVVLGGWLGGRNWLPFTTLAMLAGLDMVGIGMEDAIYRYPHKDEKIKESADCVRAVKQIADALGRKIATPEETKKIMGIPLKYGKKR